MSNFSEIEGDKQTINEKERNGTRAYGTTPINMNGAPTPDKEIMKISRNESLESHASFPAKSTEPHEVFVANRQFWLITIAICSSMFLSALDLTCVAVAIPNITSSLSGSQNSVWIGSAYTLTSTALLPWIGSLASIFGRPVMLSTSIILFSIGSLVSAVSQTMEQMIAGRAVAGVGGGGILTLAFIIICDIVPLAQRGPYFSILGCVWAVAACAGPPLSGALTTAHQWRWIFYLNLPVAGISLLLIVLFLRIKTVPRTWKEKMEIMDWWNLLFVASCTSVIIGFSWAGEQYSWKSAQVLVPIIIGFIGMIAFGVIESFDETSNVPKFFIVKNPTLPRSILNSRTAILGHFTTFLQAIVLIALTYYRAPMYFQGAKVTSALLSGVYMLPMAGIISPFAMASGIYITHSQKYKHVLLAGWALMVLGCGLHALCHEDSSGKLWATIPLVVGAGLGVIIASTAFPVQAPLEDVSLQPSAVAFREFSTSFGQVIGISISGSVVQTELRKRLPAQVLASIPKGSSITFAGVAAVEALPLGAVRDMTRKAFSDSFITLCYVLLGISALGLFVTFFIKDYEMTHETSKDWGMEDLKKDKTQEADAISDKV